MSDNNQRHGILAGGNFIVDHIKQIDHYPQQDQLARVESETLSNGGGPYNLLKNLAAMQADIPLAAVGLIGDDANGHWIVEDCRQSQIDIHHLHFTTKAETAWTDVMSVISTGRRTFFHHAGTNALLDVNHFDFRATNARIFYLGYLTLLDGLDQCDEQGRSNAAKVLEQAQAAGLTTVADTVSGNHPRFREIVASAAPHLNYLLLNELEAGWLVGRTVEHNSASLRSAAVDALRLGVATAVVVHCERGAVSALSDGSCYQQGAVRLPEEVIQGTVGAGDAFAAGYLGGVHEGRAQAECLQQAVCSAAACLTHPTTSAGLRNVNECVKLAQQYGYYDFD